MNARALMLAGAVLLSACADTDPTQVTDVGPRTTKVIRDDVVGVTLEAPEDWRVHRDEVLFNTHGIVLFDPQGADVGKHERSPVARIALAYEMKPEQIEGKIEGLIADARELNPTRIEVEVGNGLRGVGVTGLPGTDPYSLVYVVDGGRVYRIGLWAEERGISQRGREVLKSLRFQRPTRSVFSLNLVPVEKAMYAALPAEQAELSRRAQAERAPLVATNTRGMNLTAMPPAPALSSTAAACEFGAPTDLYWQTVWDNTNRFYSGYTTRYGTYYNERPGDPGWSAMSGNGGSWWGQVNTFHVNKCLTDRLNQHYANDWPAHRNANVYSAIPGTVEYAGWDYYDSEGYYTLGNFVVVRSGYYRALMAHLTSFATGIRPGVSVGANTIIGYAGYTGGDWDEHVHSRVAYGERLTAGNRPYGGNTVWPTRFYCVSCRATDPGDTQGQGDGQYDGVTTSGAKYYGPTSRFYHGRWMRG